MINKNKLHKNRIKHVATRGLRLVFGYIGLRSLQNGILTAEQLTSVRAFLSKAVKKQGYFWMRICAKSPITSKALGTRMGKGKGFVDSFVSKVRVGTVICELSGIPDKLARQLLKSVAFKLSVPSCFIVKSLC